MLTLLVGIADSSGDGDGDGSGDEKKEEKKTMLMLWFKLNLSAEKLQSCDPPINDNCDQG